MEHTSAIEQLLKRLVAISSSYPHEEKIIDFLYSYLKEKGCSVVTQLVENNRYNLLIDKGSGTKSILLYAHADTVGVVEGWNTDPHVLKIEGDRATGLGTWDMKAGIVANILAFLHSNPKNSKLKLAFCIDEEYISKGGHQLMKSNFMDDVVNVVSTEPAFSHGLQGIVTGRIGRAVYTITIKGPSKHYALYEPSWDINYALSDLIAGLKKKYKKTSDRKQFVFVRKIESKVVGMSIPERITCELDSAILPPMTHATLLSDLRKDAASIEKKYKGQISIGVNFVDRKTPFLEPYGVAKNDIYLGTMKKSIQRITRKRAVPYFRSSVADENIFGASGIPTLGIGPTGGNAHGANEWVSLSSIQKVTDVLCDYIKRVDNIK